MEKKIEHTPTPWKFEESTKTIRAVPSNYWLATMDSFDGAVDNKANAELIIRAVNVHDELVAAAQNARNVLAALVTGDLKEITAGSPALAMLRAALAKAEGK